MSHLIEDQIVNLRVIINGFLDEIINISRTKLEEEGEDTSEECLIRCKRFLFILIISILLLRNALSLKIIQ